MIAKFRSKAPGALCLFAVLCSSALTSCGGGATESPAPASPSANNTVAVTAGFGPNGQAGGYVNGIFTNIRVCQHGTTNCAAIDNVLVDTGSVGLRIIASSLGSVALTPISEDGSALQECIQYGDTSYSWGPMELADVDIAGETAPDIGVQLLGDTTAAVPSGCLTNPVNPNLPNGGNEDTLASLGANGILGIGDGVLDCGSYCASNVEGSPYYVCPNGVCEETTAPTNAQAENPVAAFTSSDNNGVVITFPAVGTTGATSLTGTMSFGIGSQSDNALGTATVHALDACGDFPTVTYGGVTYADTFCTSGSGGFGGFLDTGSSGLYVSDATTLAPLGIYDCGSDTSGYGLYCVNNGATATLSNISLLGYGNVGTATVSLNIADGTTLINTNNAVFNDLGSDSGSSPSTDYFDLGLPFFLGRTVLVGIAGESVPNNASAPYGFVAF